MYICGDARLFQEDGDHIENIDNLRRRAALVAHWSLGADTISLIGRTISDQKNEGKMKQNNPVPFRPHGALPVLRSQQRFGVIFA